MTRSPFCLIIDKLEAFAALEHYGIRAVRATWAESAQDAIAFAARGDAQDERPSPILLRAVSPRKLQLVDPSLVQGPLCDHHAIGRAYDDLLTRLAPGGRILATNVTPAGADVAIIGRSDELLGKCVTVRSAMQSAQRMVPFDEVDAQELARSFEAHGDDGTLEKTRRMLEQLLMRVSRFFEESGVESFELAPVRLHENGYAVLDATLRSRASLHVGEHGRKAHGSQPSGRQ